MSAYEIEWMKQDKTRWIARSGAWTIAKNGPKSFILRDGFGTQRYDGESLSAAKSCATGLENRAAHCG